MNKVFILTGEASGDKLASAVVSKLMKSNNEIQYLSVGGSNLSSLGIKSIFDLVLMSQYFFIFVFLIICYLFLALYLSHTNTQNDFFLIGYRCR